LVEVDSGIKPLSEPPVSPPAISMSPACGPAVGVDVAVADGVPAVAVADAVAVDVAVAVGVPAVAVAVAVGVAVVVAVAVWVEVAVAVCVAVAVWVEVAVTVAVAVGVAVRVAVTVAVAVAVAVRVAVEVAVEVVVAVELAVGVAVAVAPVAVAVAVGVAPVAVAVGVGVEAVPKAIPVRATVCVGTFPLSVKVSLPVSEVPLALVSVVGLKVTETWQLEFAATEVPQLFAVIAYDPLVAIELKVTATLLELESVTVCGADTLFTWTLPYDRVFGDTVGVARKPTPDRGTACVGVIALSVTVAVPVRVPVVEGVKVTAKVQVPPAGTFVPLHMSLTSVNSPADTTTLVTLSEILLGFVNVTVLDALVTSTCWEPKARLAGENVGLTR
jgi:hypothetical protein